MLKKNKLDSTILAIETSCDETSAAILINGKIKSNIISSQVKLHAKYGGVVPEMAAREHIINIIPIIDQALKQAKISLNQVNFLAVTQGPGLITSLLVGVDTAKAIGLALKKPVIPINHLEAHIYANFVGIIRNPKSEIRKFPAVILIVSGGHTMLVLMKNHGKYKILGETVDDAAGEAFDKTAKLLGLGYPGGPALSKLAEKGNAQAFGFPRPMINSDNLNFSFSGLKTAVLYKVLELQPITYNLKPDLAASTQQAIVDVLIGKLEKAILKFKPKTIMLGGGVAANKLLRKNFQLLSINYQLNYSIPEFAYCTDNAAMIGLAAYYKIMNHELRNINQKTKAFSGNPNLELK